MKGIYIYSTNDKDYKANGESKKVLSQVNAFRKAGVEIEFLDVIMDKKIDKIIYRLPFCGVYNKKIISRCEKEVTDADFVYLRKNIFDGTYYSLLRRIKASNPRIKVFVEIPTYPYFQEWGRFIDKPLILKEKHVIPKVTKEHLVDYYLTLTDDKEIFGIPTIKFDNCIDVDDYIPKKICQDQAEIHLIGVALLAPWHGYDRVIEGLKVYYNIDNPTKVVFHIVGEGPELNHYKQLVTKYNVEEYVIFEGKQRGNRLDHLYDISDVGVGSLGLFRIGLDKATSLKLREYCAKGIPFIKGASDEVFDNFSYCLSFSNDDEPIDITRIVDWVRKINYYNATKEMRAYAVQNLDWRKYIDIVLNKVL